LARPTPLSSAPRCSRVPAESHLLSRLACVDLDASDAAVVETDPGPLRLRRAWPRSGTHLLLEFLATKGEVIAGQWMRDEALLADAAAETRRKVPDARVLITQSGGTPVLLQAAGADRKLSHLAGYLAAHGATLVAHRAERRAVARAGDGAMYAKFVRSARHTQDALDRGRHVWTHRTSAFDAPEPLAADTSSGWVEWSALPGRSWRQSVASGAAPTVSATIGAALRTLHTVPAAPSLPVHDGAAEAEVVRRWARMAVAFGLIDDADAAAADAAASAVATLPSPGLLIHRDFHDGQVLIDDRGRVGVLDFDTLALGDPALDLGNAAAHLEFAADRGLIPREAALAHAEAFLTAYGPDGPLAARARTYATAVRIRLRCIHAFRPAVPAAASNP
jgi:aminoglycoside phosphotransferase